MRQINKLMIKDGSGIYLRHLNMNKITFRTATIAVAIMALGSVGVRPLHAAPAATTKPTTTKPAEKPVEKAAEKAAKPTPEPVIENVQNVNAEQLVDKPHDYLNKNVKFVANFFAFSSLALDYKPALRPAKTHLSFLVLKDNSHIPLSELKLAMAIPKEKDAENTLLAKLKDGDQLEITGKVFNTALDEPWVDVLRLKLLKAAPEDKKIAEEKEKDKEKEKKAGDTEVEIKGKDVKP
jgi:lysyl-tRNA synthetase class II